MYPYIILWWMKFYMTWIGIVCSFLVFIFIAQFLTKKYHQNFRKFFYRLPFLIVMTYFFGSYFTFVFDTWIIPTTWTEFVSLISPYGYKFHFTWILIGLFISISIFLRKIVRIENKKVRSDILFISLTLSLVPLWIFLLMGDNFIGATTTSWLGIKSLHSDSHRNKFNLVYPIGLFLSIASLLIVLFIKIIKKKRFGYGMLGFSIALVVISLILLIQQYPRHAVFSLWTVIFDLNQYAAWLVAIISYFTFKKRQRHSAIQ